MKKTSVVFIGLTTIKSKYAFGKWYKCDDISFFKLLLHFIRIKNVPCTHKRCTAILSEPAANDIRFVNRIQMVYLYDDLCFSVSIDGQWNARIFCHRAYWGGRIGGALNITIRGDQMVQRFKRHLSHEGGIAKDTQRSGRKK